MTEEKKPVTLQKSRIHPRSKHRERYDFKALVKSSPELKPFIKPNPMDDDTVDFSDPAAVRALNKALLEHHYDIKKWNIPENYLCPPIPGRADYIHHAADLLSQHNFGVVPRGAKIAMLDVGVGASCVYPIIAHKEYGWSAVGCDTDTIALNSSVDILNNNPVLVDKVDLRQQTEKGAIFNQIIHDGELFDITICNPPFHISEEEARKSTFRKQKNLSGGKLEKLILNFGGQSGELWTEGGERKFIGSIINESKDFGKSCFWFTSLVSKQSNLKAIYKMLEEANALEVKTIKMGQGNKSSRIVGWTFLTKEERTAWKKERW